MYIYLITWSRIFIYLIRHDVATKLAVSCPRRRNSVRFRSSTRTWQWFGARSYRPRCSSRLDLFLRGEFTGKRELWEFQYLKLKTDFLLVKRIIFLLFFQKTFIKIPFSRPKSKKWKNLKCRTLKQAMHVRKKLAARREAMLATAEGSSLGTGTDTQSADIKRSLVKFWFFFNVYFFNFVKFNFSVKILIFIKFYSRINNFKWIVQ